MNLKVNGWKKYLTCGLLGAVSTLSLPPFFIFPTLITFSLLFIFIHTSENKKQAFFTGWWFGFGHFVAGLYWISYSLLIEPEKFAWMIPFAVSLIPAILAIYVGLTALITYSLSSKISGWRRIIIFCCIWVIAEMLRAKLFTGFPWNLIGYSLDFSDNLIQIASIFGIYGLSFLAILAGTAPALLLKPETRNKSSKIFILLVIILIAITYIYGQQRISDKKPEKSFQILLVQPNISQRLKWVPELEKANVEKILKLTRESVMPDVDLIIWPEAAMPFRLEAEPLLKKRIASLIPKGSYLLLGAVRADESTSPPRIWNSAQIMDSEGDIQAIYDKHHLVPFGEFVPLRSIFPFINKITPGSMDFSKGHGPDTLKVRNLPSISPLICYEDIFPSEVANYYDHSEILINITNDGWFGDSTGPYQHFEMARIRAVEEGIPMIRSANTGISGIMDAYGSIIYKTSLNTEVTSIIEVPYGEALRTPYYLHSNNLIYLAISILILIISINTSIISQILNSKLRY